jgi:hypothetical protein
MTKRSLQITLLIGICSACSGKLVVDDTAAGAGGAGGTDSGGGAGIGSGGTGNTGAGACQMEPSSVLDGRIVENQADDYTPLWTWPLLEGVQVCVMGCDIPCETSDIEGKFTLRISAESPVVVLYTKAGYANLAIARTTGMQYIHETFIAMVRDEAAAQIASAAGLDYPLPDKSIILSGTSSNTTYIAYGLAGSTLSIDPLSLIGPDYFGEKWTPNPSLTETLANGMGFFLVEPGEYMLTASHPGRECAPRPFIGWPGPKPDTMRVPAIAGHIMSQTWFACTDP